MAAKSKKKSFKQRIIAIVMMLTGGAGIGGWQVKDHPVACRLIASLTGEEVAEDATFKDVAKAKVARIVETTLDSARPGVFEVSIDQLTLDPAAFRQGQTVELQARVRSIDSQGVERVAWDSADSGTQRAVVGRDELTASWKNRPFQVGWAPGDSLVVEVYSKRLLKEQVLFRTEAGGTDLFPLKSGRQRLVEAASSRTSGESDLNRVVLSSKRVGDRPGNGEGAASVASGRRNPTR